MGEYRKIGVLRANALGDLILTLPALEALKSSYPDAELVLLGRRKHFEFFQERVGTIDRVIVLPDEIQFNEEIFYPNQIKENVVRELWEEAFDLIIQLHGGGRFTNAFIRDIGGGACIGACTDDAPKLDAFIPYSRFQHEVLRQLEIVRLIGAGPVTLEPRIKATPTETKKAMNLLRGHLLDEEAPLVLLNPGATDPRRRWPLENFSKLKDLLLIEGCEVIVNIAPGEEIMSESFPGRVVRPELSELVGLVSMADLVVTNDTGTMHLAHALRRPTVSLFWYGNLINYAPISWKKNRVLLSWQGSCPRCGREGMDPHCGHYDSWLSSINFNSVFAASVALLKLRSEYHERENRSGGFSRGVIGQNYNFGNQRQAH